MDFSTYGIDHPFTLSGKPIFDAQEELKWRLNQSVRGLETGLPVNWKGL